MIFKLIVVLALLTVPTYGKKMGDYIGLKDACDPAVQNGGVVNKENAGKVCISETSCNPTTKVCCCADSPDGLYKRTYQDGECKLLPGSKCIKEVDQDFYRCVKGAQCTQTRKGVDPKTCAADAPCDLGDYICTCGKGKTCLDKKIATPKA